mgnify:CR=1 FL=1
MLKQLQCKGIKFLPWSKVGAHQQDTNEKKIRQKLGLFHVSICLYDYGKSSYPSFIGVPYYVELLVISV